MLRIRKSHLLTGFAVIAMMATAPALAETMMFKADLKGSSEVPPTDSTATGSAEVTVDTESKKLSWTITSSGLSGDPVAAHFHGPAAAGANAGPVVDISANIAKGSADITAEQLADLQTGNWYINIHTQKFPDGEIRSQVGNAQ